MKKLIALVLIGATFFAACGEKDDTGSLGYTCPTVEEDSCMTEELYQECLEVVADCPHGNISVMESCPYAGFGCEE